MDSETIQKGVKHVHVYINMPIYQFKVRFVAHSGFYEALDISKLSIIPASLRYMYQCSAKLLELWHLPWCLTNFQECDSIPENITNEFNGGCWWVIHVFGHSC